MSPQRSPSLTELFPGSGEAAALMRGFDWASHPLGPVESWPQALRTLVPIMLASPFAMRISWGPDHILLYNDSYRPILEKGRHPEALGGKAGEAFGEFGPSHAPALQRVRAGEAVSLEDAPLHLERNGSLEECYFRCAYSPLGDDLGKVHGVLGILHETTSNVIGVRRLATLRELAFDGALISSPQSALERGCAVLAKNAADVPFALCYLLAADGTTLRLCSQTGPADAFSIAPAQANARDSADHGWPFAKAAIQIAPLVVSDLETRFGPIHSGPYPETIKSALVLPLRRVVDGAVYGFVVAGVSPRRGLDDSYRQFFELVAQQIARAGSDALDREEREQTAHSGGSENGLVKDQFLALVSHELRNPLSAMLGWTRLLRAGKLAGDKSAHALEAIERNALTQSQLIEDLLDVSQIIDGKLRLEVKLVGFQEIIRAAIEQVRPVLESKHLELIEKLDPEAFSMMGDGPRLQQIVSNLLSNACKFTPVGGRVQIILRRDGAAVELRVIDSGGGIPSAFLPHVFDRFTQADASSTRSQGGLGIGLSIAKSLTEMHGGTIRVESEGEGAGSTFTVRLPASAQNEASPRADESRGAGHLTQPQAELAGINVLVVDDEPDARELVAEFLQQCGAKVTCADSAQNALAELSRASPKPDVILSDIRMPGEDGFSLIRKIRSLSREGGGETPAASLSAHAGVEDRQRALLLGFNINLQKPVEPAELISVVASLGKLARDSRHT